jgi:hypothetical protein
MDPVRLMMRLALLFRRPPSRRRAWIILVVLAVSAVLVGIERLVGWPDWLTPDRGTIRRM